MRRVLIVTLLFAASLASAQQGDEAELFTADEDELFGGELIVETPQTDEGSAGEESADSLLVSETVEIGGRYSFSVETFSGWTDPSTISDSFWNPEILTLTTSLSSRIFFDARPAEDFRVFGKMTVSYPFETAPDDPDDPADAPRELRDVFHVEELFSDFNWDDRVFFRGGKQTLNWGVGYFFSPADLLSVAEIDPEDPDADVEGPVALKANAPIGVNNAYAYLLPPRLDDAEPFDLGVAARGEVVAGQGEVTFGALYRRDIAPAAMVTGSYSVGDLDLFAEGVATYGSNLSFVVESDGLFGVAVEERTDEFFFHATGGVRYSYSPAESDTTFAIVGQYLFNGEGYEDQSILTDNAAGIRALQATGDLDAADLSRTGRHYSALNASLSDLFGTDATASVLWIQNYSDMSALVTPSLSRTFLDHFDVSFRVPMTFGDDGDELARAGNTLALSLAVSFGGGSF